MYGRIFLMDFMFAESTRSDFRRPRFLFVDFLVRIWLAKALLRLTFPEPVFEKRLAAPLLVFIFGIVILLFDPYSTVGDVRNPSQSK
jgi:hypothetical protein